MYNLFALERESKKLPFASKEHSRAHNMRYAIGKLPTRYRNPEYRANKIKMFERGAWATLEKSFCSEKE